MPADSPVSWFFLLILGGYGVYRFFKSIYIEYEQRKTERERASQEIFFENAIDKRNIAMYNRYINKERYKK